jgi:hypothetical protein
MKLQRMVRFSMTSILMLVVMSAAASALFAKVHKFVPSVPKSYLKIDAPILFIASIGLTAIALAAVKNHNAMQTMLQITVACLGYLSLIWLAESGRQRPLLYWFQISFGLLVSVPLLARRIVKSEMPRGPRRELWKKNLDAFYLAFLTMILVLGGILLQWLVLTLSGSLAALLATVAP